MKKLLKYFVAVSCGIVLISCYGLEKEEYRELAPITVSGLEQTIYAKATEKLTLNSLRVESDSSQEIAYEWSYGRPDGDFPGMVDTTFISSSPTLDYACGSTTARASVSTTTTCACSRDSTKAI